MDNIIPATMRLELISPKLNKWTTTELLLYTLLGSFLVWFVKFHWSRRKLYEYASKLPGPVAYPIVGSAYLFFGSPCEIFERLMKLSDEHPKKCKFWFGPRLFYVISDAKYFEILLPNCLEKEEWYTTLNYVIGEGLLTARYKTWKRHRKLISPTFNQRILDKYVPIFNEQSKIFIDQLRSHVGKREFDILKLIFNFTLDIICETAMGVAVNAQTTKCRVSQCCDRAMEIVFLKIFVMWYHIHPIFSMTRLSKELSESTRTIHNFTGKVIEEKLAKFENSREQFSSSDEGNNIGSKRKPFLDYLIGTCRKENSSFTEKELQDEVVTFILAGSDTTAVTNGFTCTMLGLHQDLQEKVYNEVMDVLGPDRDVESEDLPRLIYLERFIKETLRLFPVGPFILREIHKDIDLGDMIVPAGISVLFSIFKLHRDEEYWKDPLVFNPDRFLPEEVAKRPPSCYIPFSYGPRNCIGMKYAMMAMKTLFANVVRKYKFYTPYTKIEDVKVKCNLVIRPKDGFKVNVELR